MSHVVADRRCANAATPTNRPAIQNVRIYDGTVAHVCVQQRRQRESDGQHVPDQERARVRLVRTVVHDDNMVKESHHHGQGSDIHELVDHVPGSVDTGAAGEPHGRRQAQRHRGRL